MLATTTKMIALAMVAALVSTTTASDGYVTLYEDRDFWGYSTTIDLELGRCIQVTGYMANRASSAKWFGFSGQTDLMIGFYDSIYCTGRTSRAWAFDSPRSPSNFAADYINDMVMAVRVYKR